MGKTSFGADVGGQLEATGVAKFIASNTKVLILDRRDTAWTSIAEFYVREYSTNCSIGISGLIWHPTTGLLWLQTQQVIRTYAY